MEIEETWCGLRPTTPDKAPVLGETPWPGVHVAGGYWRNGVLLAPKTAQLLASSILGTIGGADSDLLNHFKWDRFISPEGGAKIAVASRWASQMHPVYYRSEGVGVSGSVGSEVRARPYQPFLVRSVLPLTPRSLLTRRSLGSTKEPRRPWRKGEPYERTTLQSDSLFRAMDETNSLAQGC